MRIVSFLAMFTSLSLATAARAGTIYPRECYCQPGNCQSVPCSELAPQEEAISGPPWKYGFMGGYSWAAKRWAGGGPIYATFPASKVHTSPDGQCHVCIFQHGGGQNDLCVFIPNASS